jgi:hypothetical protein
MESISDDHDRNMVDRLVSAGGETPVFIDPPESKSWSEVREERPGFTCRVNSEKFAGVFAVYYDRAMDAYDIVCKGEDGTNTEITYVMFDELMTRFDELLGNSAWQAVKIDVLKAAPKKRVQHA